MSDGFRTTNLPLAEGDIVELVVNARVQGIGPLATRRAGFDTLQQQFLQSTSLVGARLVAIEARLATAESFTNQITGLGSRVATLEGLAGISPGTDLAADGTAVRSTRYWPRPGEAIRAWTSNITATAQTAAPLAVGGAYSITTDGPGKGPALRITGNAYATSIAKTHLDDAEVVEFTFRIARRVENTSPSTPANNAPALEFRCYKADLTDNGTVALPTTVLLIADGLRTVTYRACLTPGIGSVDLPANTRFISPLFGERGNGAIELTSADRRTAATRPLTTAENALTLRLMMVDALGNESVLSPASTKSFIQGLSMELPTFSSEPPGLTAELTSKVILPPDDQRKNFQVQCETHDLAVNWTGRDATFEKDAIVFAGVIPDWLSKGKEAVSVIARPAALRTVPGAAIPAKLWVSQDRLVPGYISGSLYADQVLAAYPNPDFKKSYRSVLRDQLNRLNDLGAMEKGTVFTVPVHARENLIVNLANPKLKMTVVEPTTAGRMVLVPYISVASGGDSYIRSGLMTAASMGVTADGHFFAAQVAANATFETGIGIAGNSPSLILKPNSAAGKAGVRSGGSNNIAIDAASTAWIAMNRALVDRFTAYSETVTGDQSQVLATADREFTICAVNTSSNVAPTVSNQGLRGLWLGYGLQSAATVLAIRDAMKAIFAAADAAAAA